MDKPSNPHSSLDQIPTSYATVSVGTPSTALPQKLSAISSAGFKAIELGFTDLVSFASPHFKKEINDHDFKSLCEAGMEVKKLCEKNKWGIMMLQPFSNFEGWPEESQERGNAFVRARGWIEIMKAVGTDLLQVRPFTQSFLLPKLLYANHTLTLHSTGRLIRFPIDIKRPQPYSF